MHTSPAEAPAPEKQNRKDQPGQRREYHLVIKVLVSQVGHIKRAEHQRIGQEREGDEQDLEQ